MDRASVAEQILRSMPEPVSRTARRIMASPALESCLTPAQIAVILAPGHVALDEAKVQLLVLVVARIGAVICTVCLQVPPPDPSEIDGLILLRLLDGKPSRPAAAGDVFAQQSWGRRADGWRELGDERNAVLATACALLSSISETGGRAPSWQGVERVDLAIGAAGAFILPQSVRPALRRAVRDNLALL